MVIVMIIINKNYGFLTAVCVSCGLDRVIGVQQVLKFVVPGKI